MASVSVMMGVVVLMGVSPGHGHAGAAPWGRRRMPGGRWWWMDGGTVRTSRRRWRCRSGTDRWPGARRWVVSPARAPGMAGRWFGHTPRGSSN
ncbi:MAG: hypothetical protein MZU95_16465 [Desulfomicrobium escambiense]|nr:hypothetical protein [Desulfomicrobium escambiense]